MDARDAGEFPLGFSGSILGKRERGRKKRERREIKRGADRIPRKGKRPLGHCNGYSSSPSSPPLPPPF